MSKPNETSEERILILDFGSQYNQLIARRVREIGIYCEIKPFSMTLDQIKAFDPLAIILSGGPSSVYDTNSPKIDKGVFCLGVPVLGICYGAQLMAHTLGGKVVPADSLASREYGRTETEFDTKSSLFRNITQKSITWMSHGDSVKELPAGFTATAHSKGCPFAGFEDKERRFYAVQFHPEVNHSEKGRDILRTFLIDIAGAKANWSMANYKQTAIDSIRAKVRDGKALLALSGGVDSSVAAALMSQAIGKNLTCVFVDHGLMRKDEGDQVQQIFSAYPINFIRVNAQDLFLEKLAGVSEPEKKRKIIGEEFIRVFEAEAKKIGKVDFLVQGTIYPDVIESGLGSNAAVIKSHHNVGGLPDYVDFKEIIEPLRFLFKDEVRQLGRELGLPEYLVSRQPFPGPGLAIRIIGDITQEKLSVLREADWIFRSEIEDAKVPDASQYFAVLTNTRSVGVMGDGRTYEYTLALRCVSTTDFMTATFTRIPYELLEKISHRIVNEVPHINRVVYDITAKPPATVEWE
ncbi:MAG: glutamine-hydrolyzing GMP synthase [Spirochaetales bacterium]|nr:glutamine-hydrolyzing GMP synthase [Spirochaetales bacterium]MBQ4501133.1 glutamine-hydrolyzing GMP synthase [Spirochaetales bacterium]